MKNVKDYLIISLDVENQFHVKINEILANNVAQFLEQNKVDVMLGQEISEAFAKRLYQTLQGEYMIVGGFRNNHFL